MTNNPMVDKFIQRCEKKIQKGKKLTPAECKRLEELHSLLVKPAEDIKEVCPKFTPDELELLKKQREEEERQRLANRTKACESCPGYCCTAFTLRNMPEQLQQAISGDQKKIADLLAQWDRHHTVLQLHFGLQSDRTLDRIMGEIGWRSRNIRDSEFILDWMVPIHIKGVDDHPERGQHGYTCMALDGDKGRCTQYESRPSFCRSFGCQTSDTIGKPPPLEEMFAHPESSLEAFARIAKSVKLPLRIRTREEYDSLLKQRRKARERREKKKWPNGRPEECVTDDGLSKKYETKKS